MKICVCIVALLFTISLGAGSSLVAQSAQRGQVLLYQGEKQKTPLSNVSIAAAGAPVVTSDAQGEFTLNFRTHHAGDDIYFRRIELAGYEVMNQEALENARVANPNLNENHNVTPTPLTIVMIRKETLRKLREGYRSVAALRYQKQLEASTAEIERLHEQGKMAKAEYDERMSRLEEKYEEKLSKLESYIDKFARIDILDLNQDEQRIIDLIKTGDFEAALQIYESQNLSERIKQNRADRTQLVSARDNLAAAARQKEVENQRLRASINRQVTLLRMEGSEANYLKATDILYQTFLADTTDVEARKDYALCLMEQGRLQERIDLLQAGIDIEADSVSRGMLALDLMTTLWMNEQHEAAYRCALQIDSLMTPFQQENPNVATRGLPLWSLYKLYYLQENGRNSACKEIADRIEREWSPDTLHESSCYYYTQLLDAMSVYYSTTSKHEKSLWCTRQGLHLAQVVERRYPWLGNLQITAADACPILMMEGMTEEACQTARLSAQLTGAVLDKNHLKTTLFDAVSNYYLISETLVNAGQYQLADSIIRSAEQRNLYELIRGMENQNIRLYILLTKLLQARAWLHVGDLAEAEALAIQSLSEIENHEDGADLIAYFRPDALAQIHLAKGDLKEAEAQCNEVIRVCQEAYAESQDAWDADNLCRAYLLLAEVQLQAKAKGKAKAALKQAQKVAAFASNHQAIELMNSKLK